MKEMAFATRLEAEARSREEWERHLGRKKRPEDVTEFLWAMEEASDGKAALLIPEADEARLTVAERRTLTARVAQVDDAVRDR